ncbi:glycosyltransferase [Oribacterium sp. P6A1]|uniref:glycosyltransferase n=1 Tax=Oribacterium sp. P6A1 TaxID=1410612 RepID=UPI0005665B51|nr:glycosyltransferase [Oribacterium sp. P6A1]
MNVIVYDFPERKNDIFAERIIETTGESWEVLGLPKGENELLFIWKLFIHRKKYDKIVFWQQRQGIFYANFCELFHVKKGPKVFILTFIYKPLQGIKGKLKYILYNKTVHSKHVMRIICYSKYEVKYYGDMFSAPKGKIVSTLLGLGDQRYRNGDHQVHNEGYILDAGRSNRDHAFLEDALKNTDYKAIIADRTYNGEGNDNCEIRHDVKYGEDLYKLIEKSFVVIVPLKDVNISAGQTVFIQAMMFAKPIIVTSSKTIDEYICNGQNGFIIEKEKDSLLKCLDVLSNNTELYNEMCLKSRIFFEEKYSFEALGTNTGKIIVNSLSM